MRKIFNERSIVILLFIVALVVFSFASEDARKIEARNFQAGTRLGSPTLVDNAGATQGTAARD